MFKVRTLILLIFLAVAVRPTEAAMSVVDSAAIAKLSAQLSELRKQFEELAKVNEQLQSTLDAIGDAGRITLPTANLTNLARQFQSDLQCMTPDWQSLMPRIDFDEVDLGSICKASRFYRDSLFVDRKALERAGTWDEQNELRRHTEERRDNVLIDAATKSLAQADQNQENATALSKAADDLANTVKTAKNQNERLAVIGQGHVLNARAQAKIIQVLSQMQRADAAFYLKAGAGVDQSGKAGGTKEENQ